MTGSSRVLVALPNQDNDYQRAQARAADESATSRSATAQICFCDGDAVEQSQQILKCVLSKSETPPSGIIVQPVGTGLYQVARAAVAAGIGWVVLHRRVDYLSELRGKYGVPVFEVSSNHTDEGQIQAKQLGALVPGGGKVLHIVGPSTDSVSQQRSSGMTEAKPENVQLMMMRGNWTQDSGYKAVLSWWSLPTSRQQPIVAVVAQNDAMAVGAKKALQELGDDRLLAIPVIGCDGLPEFGQTWVQKGLLSATVVVPVLAGVAVEMLLHALVSKAPIPEHTVIAPSAYPTIDSLTARRFGMFAGG